MKHWLLMACLLGAAGLVQAAEVKTPPAKVAPGAYLGAKPSEYPSWFKDSFLDLREDVAEAARNKKRVLLLFTQDNCPYCNLLVERNLAQREIEATLRARYDVIAFNMWGDRPVIGMDGITLREKHFASSFAVQFTPTLVFLDEAGKVGLRLNGYVAPERFKAAIDWASGPQKSTFRDYVAALELPAQGSVGELIAEPYFKKTDDLRRVGKHAAPLAVFFEQRDCPECQTLHKRVLTDPSVLEAMKGFDVVQLDLWSGKTLTLPDGRSLAMRDWARELEVKYAPSIVLIAANGKEVIRWEAAFRVFHTAGMFDYVKSGAWRKEPSFQRYLSAHAEHIRASGRDVNIWRYADEK